MPRLASAEAKSPLGSFRRRSCHAQSACLRIPPAQGFRPAGREGGFPIAPSTPSAPAYGRVSHLKLAGRGGSVSRRDHNPAAGNRTHSQAEPTPPKPHPPNASRSSGEGVWGRGASLREAASPPESLHSPVFSRGSAREGPFLQKRLLPRKIYLYYLYNGPYCLQAA